MENTRMGGRFRARDAANKAKSDQQVAYKAKIDAAAMTPNGYAGPIQNNEAPQMDLMSQLKMFQQSRAQNQQGQPQMGQPQSANPYQPAASMPGQTPAPANNGFTSGIGGASGLGGSGSGGVSGGLGGFGSGQGGAPAQQGQMGKGGK